VTGKQVETSSVPALLNVGDVCGALRISRTTLWRLVRDREIAIVKIGDRTLFEPAAVEAFIASQRREAVGVL
jgi:excisionase family DNA binding protein